MSWGLLVGGSCPGGLWPDTVKDCIAHVEGVGANTINCHIRPVDRIFEEGVFLWIVSLGPMQA